MYHGDIALGETIDIKFSTRRFSSGAPFTLAGSPVISAYVDNGTTEITAGITLTVDFDGRTGLNNVRVVGTSGNGFATGTNVTLVITTGTVDSVSVVGECVGAFSIEKRSTANLAGLINTVDDFLDTEIAAILAAVDTEVATIVTQTAAAAIRTAVGLASANLDTQLSTIDDFLDTEVAAILAAVDTEVAAIVTATTAAAIRTALGLASANLDTQLTAIDDYIDSEIATIVSQTTAASIRSAVGLASANLDTQLSAIDDYVDTEIAAILAAVDTEIASILADTNELQTDWTDGGRLDLILDARASQASVDTVDDLLDTEVAAILAAVDTEIAAIITTLGALWTTALVESYRVAGAAPSPAQALFEIIAHLGDSSITGTTKTLRTIAGTAAKTFTLDSAVTPTSITEAT